MERFRVDTIELGRGFALEDRDWADWVAARRLALPDARLGLAASGKAGEWVLRVAASGRVLAKMPDGALYFEQCYWPFLEQRRPRPPAARPWPRTCGARVPVAARAAGRRAGRDRGCWPKGPGPCGRRPTGRSSASSAAICWRPASSSTATTTSSCSWPPTPTGPTSFSIGWSRSIWPTWRSISRAVGPYIDVIVFGDDLGMQSGPQMSPAMYRELFKPRHARMWRRAKELADVKVMLHCCGGVRPLAAGPDRGRPGRDQSGADHLRGHGRGRAEGRLRRPVTFWGGGCDTRFVLCQRHAGGDSRSTSASRSRSSSRGGGFVFQQVHNILADVPPENVIAMFDAAFEFGGYP